MTGLGSRRVMDEADRAQLLATIDHWVERKVKPVVKEHDHADRWPDKIVADMRELGLFGATVGTEYGGLGLPASVYAEIVKRILSVWMAIPHLFQSHTSLGSL